MSSVAAWSKVGNLDDLVAVLVDVDTLDRLLRDHNSVDHLLDQASKEDSADEEALEIEVGASEVDSTTEEEVSVGEAASVGTVEDLVLIEVDLVGEEALATKIGAASRTAHRLLVLRVDLDREVASDLAHQMEVTKTEDAMAMVEIDVVEEVAMTPEILEVSVAATETPSETEVGTATVIDMPTDLDETKIMGPESDITRANNMTIRDRSGGIEHHIPMRFVGGYSLFNSFDFCLVFSSSRVRRYCITTNNYQKHQAWR